MIINLSGIGMEEQVIVPTAFLKDFRVGNLAAMTMIRAVALLGEKFSFKDIVTNQIISTEKEAVDTLNHLHTCGYIEHVGDGVYELKDYSFNVICP